MHTFREIISQWGTVAAFATAVGTNERTAMSWWQRRSIPAKWFGPTVRAAEAAGYNHITADQLVLLAERRSRPTLPAQKQNFVSSEAS